MSASAVTISEAYSQRYEVLLRATNAIGTCTDCDSATDGVLKTLLEVVPCDYLQVVAFEGETRAVAWHLLYSNGTKHDLPLADVVVDDTPMEWVHGSQQALVTTDWSTEPRFREHGEFLNQLGIASTCTLPLARGERRLGVLSLGSARPHAYPDDEVRLRSQSMLRSISTCRGRRRIG
jgi:GAF domain-containing protein